MCYSSLADPPPPLASASGDRFAAAETSTSGDSRGRYELVELIGAGANATVHRALDTRSGEAVAVKVLRTASSRQHRAAVLEVMMNLRVKHRLAERDAAGLVPPLLDVCDACSSGEVSLVFGLLQGGTLLSWLEALEAKGSKPTGAEVKTVLRRLLSAVAMLHASGVAHCDIKPANLMLGRPGDLDSLSLIDLGYAFDMLKDDGFRQAQGTPHFCAPEQARAFYSADSAAYGPQVDVWAAGVCLFRLLTGEMPFTGRNAIGVFRSILAHEGQFHSALLAECGADARDLLSRLMHPDPLQRISAQQALQHPFLQSPAAPPSKPVSKADNPLSQIYGRIASRRASMAAVDRDNVARALGSVAMSTA